MPVGFHVADHGFDGESPSWLSLDDGKDAALLS